MWCLRLIAMTTRSSVLHRTRRAATVLGMRVVCSFVGGAGHLVPQIPLHRALATDGHTLVLSGRASAMGAAPRQLYSRIVAREDPRNGAAGSISPLTPVDMEHELNAVGDYFAGRAAWRTAEHIRGLLPGAGLVVCDELDFGAMAAAQEAGIPTVVVAVIASGALVRSERLRGPLGALSSSLTHAGPIRPHGDFFVVPFAPSMRDPDFPTPPNSLWMRPDIGSEPRPDGSLVATLGTEFNTESGDLFDRILAALTKLGIPATVAIGRDLDPAQFGRQPEFLNVEQYVDFDALLPRASTVMHHGGSGLFTRCILGGAPQVVFPMGADQPFTARQVSRLGVGRVLDPLTVTRSHIIDAVRDLQEDSAMRERILELRESLVSLPSPSRVVRQLLTAAE